MRIYTMYRHISGAVPVPRRVWAIDVIAAFLPARIENKTSWQLNAGKNT